MTTETRAEPAYTVPRRFIRHTADVPLEVERTGGGAGLTPSATNVSYGGLSFVSDEELPIGTEIRVRITQVQPPFDAEARVVWCKAEGDGFWIGVQFLGKEDAFRIRMVEQVCAIDQYRREVAEQGRELTPEEAATEWITRFADRFPSSGG